MLLQKYGKKLYLLLLSFCSLYAIAFYGRNGLEPQKINGIRPAMKTLSDSLKVNEGLSIFFVWLLLIIFYSRMSQKQIQPDRKAYLIASAIGMIDVVGKNLLLNNGFIYFNESIWFPILFSFLSFIGTTSLWARFYCIIMNVLSEKSHADVMTPGSRFHFFVDKFFNKHTMIHVSIFLMCFWLPYFAAFYPGFMQMDAYGSLRQYQGIYPWNTHQPPFPALIMGYVMDLGKTVLNEKAGCTIYIILQAITFAVTLSYSFKMFSKWNTPYWVRVFVLLFYSFYPFIPAYAFMEIKDTNYCIVGIWLLYSLISFIEQKGKTSLHTFIRLFSFGLLFCLYRNEGKYIIMLLAISALFAKIGTFRWNRIAFSLLMCLIVGLSALVTKAICDIYKISEAPSAKEALSLPIQQMARYIRNHGYELTQEEWASMDPIFKAAYKLMDRYYDPNISDPAKGQVNDDIGQHLDKFIGVWFQQLLKHPGTYIAAALNQTYGYYYIDKPEHYQNLFSTDSIEFLFYGDYSPVEPSNLFKLINENYVLCNELPIIKLFLHPSFYTWIFLFIFFFKKKYKVKGSSFLFVLPAAAFIVCCLSPINASMRYAMPMIFYSITIFSYVLHQKSISDNTFE